MKNNILGIIYLTLLMSSCTFIRIDDSIDLGNKYRYIQEYPQVIIYNTSSKSKATGINIVPPIVISYAFNDKYIIAKSQEADEITGSVEGKSIKYWIIDKKTNGAQTESLDSINFYKKLKELNIDLKFKNPAK